MRARWGRGLRPGARRSPPPHHHTHLSRRGGAFCVGCRAARAQPGSTLIAVRDLAGPAHAWSARLQAASVDPARGAGAASPRASACSHCHSATAQHCCRSASSAISVQHWGGSRPGGGRELTAGPVVRAGCAARAPHPRRSGASASIARSRSWSSPRASRSGTRPALASRPAPDAPHALENPPRRRHGSAAEPSQRARHDATRRAPTRHGQQQRQEADQEEAVAQAVLPLLEALARRGLDEPRQLQVGTETVRTVHHAAGPEAGGSARASGPGSPSLDQRGSPSVRRSEVRVADRTASEQW